MRVLVTGARTHYSLPVIRALGRAGHEVTAADCSPRSVGFFSRYTTGRWIHPVVGRDPEGFATSLEDLLRATPHDVVLPLFEEALPIARARERLSRLTRVPLADYPAFLRFHDKAVLYRTAEAAGIPVPSTRSLPDPSRAVASYPAVLKVPQASSARGVAVVRNRVELRAAAERLVRSHRLPSDVPLLVQRHVAGVQVCVLAFAWHGRPKGAVVYRNVCEIPVTGGAGVVRETIRHPVIERHVERLLRASAWHGLVGFDFLEERGTGEVFLIDANPRCTPGVVLGMRAGVDFPAMAITETEPEPRGVAAAGLRSRVEPFLALWLLQALAPRHVTRERLRVALDLLLPKARSGSDVFDLGDLRSLLGMGAAALDVALAALRGTRGLEFVAESQFADYGASC
jgi:predicted ATP-grasp superfamily ATP-dependent carboligase